MAKLEQVIEIHAKELEIFTKIIDLVVEYKDNLPVEFVEKLDKIVEIK